MRGRKGTSNHRRIKRRTIRSRKHQTRRKTFKKGGNTYDKYVEYTKSDNPNAVLLSKADWQAKYDEEHKDDAKLNDPAFYYRNAPQQQQPFNPYL
jgi:uncharacterized short protein YbdD (DUF466 family)